MRQTGEGFLLGELLLRHQEPLCALDQLAGRQSFGERLGFGARGGELLVARLRGGQRGDEILFAERLYEVAEDAGVDRARDELVLPVGGEHDDRDGSLLENAARRIDAVEVRHLHVHHDQVRLVLAGEGNRLLAVAGLGYHLVAGALEQGAKVEPDDRFILGDENAHRT